MRKHIKTLVIGLALHTHTHTDTSLDNDCEKKRNQRILNSQRGSLTMVAFFTILIFSMYGIMLYARSASAYIRQSKSIETIQQTYAKDVPNAARIAEQLGVTSSEILEDGEMIVIFNANGGNVDTARKKVTYGETYGDLPVPTREGYTFKGWNGKNMFELKEAPDFVLANTNYDIKLEDKSVTLGGNSQLELIEFYLPPLKANTIYVLSEEIELINKMDTQVGISKNRAQLNGNVFIYRNLYVQNGKNNHIFTTGNSIENSSALLLYGNWGSIQETARVKVKNIMLEEGTEATEYEPYYITPGTKVTQRKNHTLTAIWEENN